MFDSRFNHLHGFEYNILSYYPILLEKWIHSSSDSAKNFPEHFIGHDAENTAIINVPLGQFGGPLKNGDMVALLNVIEHLRRVSGINIRAFLSPNVIHDTEYNHKFHRFLLDYSDYLSPHAGSYQLDCNAVNLWDYRCISGDIVTVLNPYERQKKICVFPVFDANYNQYRNWPIELINDIIEEYSSDSYSDYEKHFCAISLPDGVNLRNFTASVDFNENLRHIMTCEIFVGGDTGTSHFASVLRRGPKKKIYYYATGSAIHTLPFHLSDGHSELRSMWSDDSGKSPLIRQTLLMEMSKMRIFALRDGGLGDALTAFPALYRLAETQNFRIWIGNPEVRSLWDGPQAVLLSEDPGDSAENVSIQMIYNSFSSGSGLHMAQAWHWCLGLPIPRVWPRPPLNIKTDPSPDVDVFISPISNSDAGTGLKLWSNEKWCKVIDVLLAAGLTVAVGGQFSQGRSSRFWGNRPVVEVDNPPLRELGSLLWSARCVVSVDNGVAHFAHFLGVPHVHLVPEAPTLSSREWVENRNEEALVIYERFAYLTPESVLGAIFTTLGKFNLEAYWEANRDLEHVKPKQDWRASEIWVHYVFCGRREGRTLRPS